MTHLAIDHLAFPSWDVAATHDFYTRVLGFAFAGASRGDDGWGHGAFLHFGYRLGDAVLTFFDVEGFARPDDGLPADLRHIALRVESFEAVEDWHDRLRAAKTHCWTEQHGAARSVYVDDPNGIAIEFTHGPAANGGRRSLEVLERWVAESRVGAADGLSADDATPSEG
jgi:catechol 2,3-dioxygenase-like lactoylglutathione lyase family enzyme